jgi:hypothetical protein
VIQFLKKKEKKKDIGVTFLPISGQVSPVIKQTPLDL